MSLATEVLKLMTVFLVAFICKQLFKFKPQTWMNALKALTVVMIMQLVTTLKEVTPAHAILDTQGMDLHASVSSLNLC